MNEAQKMPHQVVSCPFGGGSGLKRYLFTSDSAEVSCPFGGGSGLKQRQHVHQAPDGFELYLVNLVQVSGKAVKVATACLIEQSEGRWGYKAMSETEGPYYHNCPASLLDLCDPPLNPAAAAWRDRVRGVA